MSDLYSASSHTQESISGVTVPIAAQILYFRCCRSHFFDTYNVHDVTPAEKIKKGLLGGQGIGPLQPINLFGNVLPKAALTTSCSEEELHPAVDKCHQQWVDHELEGEGDEKKLKNIQKYQTIYGFFFKKGEWPKDVIMH